ncbi:cation:proton antiporter, partial [Hymenobacter agri]
MNQRRETGLYTAVIIGLIGFIAWAARTSIHLEPVDIKTAAGNAVWADFRAALQHGWQSPLALLLAQMVTILLAARVLGYLCRRLGQPAVVGEMAAGVLLGPSLLGRYFPVFSARLFPRASLENIRLLSQVGLMLFMFVVGMELDLRALRGKARQAVVISHASIALPFALGLGLAYFLYHDFAPVGVQFVSFGLFMGIAMSITAFPVLARIVRDRGLHRTPLGTLVITCAAADDVTAWCLLAAVIA